MMNLNLKEKAKLHLSKNCKVENCNKQIKKNIMRLNYKPKFNKNEYI